MCTQRHTDPLPTHKDTCLSCTHFLLHTSSHLVSYTHILLRTQAVFSQFLSHVLSLPASPLHTHPCFLSTLRACGEPFPPDRVLWFQNSARGG